MGAFVLQRYRVSLPHQFLVRTGPCIQGVKVSKQGLQWPFQTASFLDVTPRPYVVILENAMSKQRLQFRLPAKFTVGPRLDTASLEAYAQKMSEGNMDTLVSGIVDGEMRIQSRHDDDGRVV